MESQSYIQLIPNKIEKERKAKTKWDKQGTNNKRTELNLTISIITLMVNNPRIPIKKQNVRLDKKADPPLRCLGEMISVTMQVD